jgi:hypothetical protein
MRTGATQCPTSWPPLWPPVAPSSGSNGTGGDDRRDHGHDATRNGYDEGR